MFHYIHKALYNHFGLGPRVRDVSTIAANYDRLQDMLEVAEGMTAKQTPYDFKEIYHLARRELIQTANVSVSLPYFDIFEANTLDDFIDQLRRANIYIQKLFDKELEVDEVASIVDHIEDEDLRSRCDDLLQSTSNFDRVIREATVVLENRIRQYSKKKGSGKDLLDEVLHEDPSQGILKLDARRDVYFGYRQIIHGIFKAHRNEAHHTIMDVRRIDAARICSYINMLLLMIDKAGNQNMPQKTE